MITPHCAISNIQYRGILSYSFEELLNGIERTADGIFRIATPGSVSGMWCADEPKRLQHVL